MKCKETGVHPGDRSPVNEPAPIIDDRGPDPRRAEAGEPRPGDIQVDLAVDGDHAVEWLSGEIDLASSGRLLEVGATAIADPRVDGLVLDFTRVTFLDSTGLGAIVELRKQAQNADKVLTLRGVTPAVAKVFHLTGLDTPFGLDAEDAGRC